MHFKLDPPPRQKVHMFAQKCTPVKHSNEKSKKNKKKDLQLIAVAAIAVDHVEVMSISNEYYRIPCFLNKCTKSK